jgi:hypothetical protein
MTLLATLKRFKTALRLKKKKIVIIAKVICSTYVSCTIG